MLNLKNVPNCSCNKNIPFFVHIGTLINGMRAASVLLAPGTPSSLRLPTRSPSRPVFSMQSDSASLTTLLRQATYCGGARKVLMAVHRRGTMSRTDEEQEASVRSSTSVPMAHDSRTLWSGLPEPTAGGLISSRA